MKYEEIVTYLSVNHPITSDNDLITEKTSISIVYKEHMPNKSELYCFNLYVHQFSFYIR